MNLLMSSVLIIAPVLAIYWFWLRPVLQENPTLKEFYEQERSWFQAFRDKVMGLKQKLTTIAIVTATTVVSIHDLVLPVILSTDTSSLTGKVPTWVWPIATISLTLLIQFFRNLADKRDR